MLVGQHDLQGGVKIGHVKPDKPGGGQRAFQHLDIQLKGNHEQQVDNNQYRPALAAQFLGLLGLRLVRQLDPYLLDTGLVLV